MASPPADKALSQLIGPEIEAPAGASDLMVRGMTLDSRKAGPGIVFAAVPGANVDGAAFAADAVANGALAILAGTDAVASQSFNAPQISARLLPYITGRLDFQPKLTPLTCL